MRTGRQRDLLRWRWVRDDRGHAIVAAKLPAAADGRTYYKDAKTPGLVLCVWQSGVKSFELYRRIAGRPRRLKIGRFPEVTVAHARKEAARLAGQIAQGRNPADLRRKARNETTLANLWELYLAKHAKLHKRTWKEDERQWKAYFARLQARRLSHIRQADVRDWHAAIGKEHGHCQANRALALLSSMFTFAQGEGYDGPNPCKGIRRFKEQSRDRFLAADELRRPFAALDAEGEPWDDFFRVLLLTGARIANVMAMQWADLELGRGLWHVPGEESKTGDPLVVILTPPVVDILRRRRAAERPAIAASPARQARGGRNVRDPGGSLRRHRADRQGRMRRPVELSGRHPPRGALRPARRGQDIPADPPGRQRLGAGRSARAAAAVPGRRIARGRGRRRGGRREVRRRRPRGRPVRRDQRPRAKSAGKTDWSPWPGGMSCLLSVPSGGRCAGGGACPRGLICAQRPADAGLVPRSTAVLPIVIHHVRARVRVYVALSRVQ
ncbi:MAG: integrase family protein [Planctomycetes bacterium]|nr:integrase family protein [Planctomycetota bacterium]